MCAACGSDCALWYPLKILPFFFLFSNLRLDFDTAPFFTKGRRRGRTTSLSRIAWSLRALPTLRLYRPTSRHRTSLAHGKLKTRSQSDVGVALQLHGSARGRLRWQHRARGSPVQQAPGIGLRMICKAPSIATLIGMINTDHVAIAHLPDSLHLGRVQLEVSLCRPREHGSRALQRGI